MTHRVYEIVLGARPPKYHSRTIEHIYMGMRLMCACGGGWRFDFIFSKKKFRFALMT